jgi:hypothetical protein
VLDPFVEFNPMVDFGQAVLAVEFAPLLLGPPHQQSTTDFEQQQELQGVQQTRELLTIATIVATAGQADRTLTP